MLSDEDLRKLQHALADMLKVFDGFCREHNINYVLAGGTLLGAVRHQGFIPWDDDVDLIMLPEEFEKFNAVRHLLPAPFVAKDLPGTGITKVFDVSRKLETGTDGLGHPFLDIFPMRAASPGEVLLTPLRKRVRGRHAFPRWHPGYWFWSLVRNPVRWLWRRRKTCSPVDGFHLIYESESFANWTIRPEQLKAVRREEVRFEGECYPVPADTEGYLRIEYGDDFMTPHPPELRHYHIKAIHF
ncbi:LicD family protein [Sutterella parvirubra]|uniref:LICD family protein n=1 Tax=Sutterella parvirubra YIT 11816 TaxID=762967 RepID=H3KGD9_9BURK|nr:LicD family protein [Sutterella parvirubra]EHY30819.1 LICD family protein [Sutterella parvirubra YIT 11816]MDR3770539.1 LicD family protein [Sutterella sp.]